ncbi:MAG: hypothetical protein O6914_01395 [Chloroflexi bacterium]|nr:hypothetical protein [Chloroflexota bacterium]
MPLENCSVGVNVAVGNISDETDGVGRGSGSAVVVGIGVSGEMEGVAVVEGVWVSFGGSTEVLVAVGKGVEVAVATRVDVRVGVLS